MSARRVTFEGREVIGTEVVVAGAAADSDDHDPYHVGDIVYLVCEVVVDRVGYKPVKDSDKLVRVEHARCLVGAVVERELVQDAVQMARMNAEAKQGVQQLGFGDGDDVGD